MEDFRTAALIAGHGCYPRRYRLYEAHLEAVEPSPISFLLHRRRLRALRHSWLLRRKATSLGASPRADRLCSRHWRGASGGGLLRATHAEDRLTIDRSLPRGRRDHQRRFSPTKRTGLHHRMASSCAARLVEWLGLAQRLC